MNDGLSIFKYPKILIISNNAFSNTSNNGKTLASFFKEYPKSYIAQLYFSENNPSKDCCENFYKITDNDIIRSILNKNFRCGGIVCNYCDVNSAYYSKNNNIIEFLKKINSIRIIREIIWNSRKWDTKDFNIWLNDFSPEVIFFCAGDSGFAYNIVNTIIRKFKCKLVIYITDDYILPRKTINLFWWIRRNYIMKKMKIAISNSNLFITISDKMKFEYKKIFKKDSIIVVNMPDSMKREGIIKNNNTINLIYAGELHFKRYETLNLLGKAIEKYNLNHNTSKKAFLKIYCINKPTNKKVLKMLNIKNASQYLGRLNRDKLIEALNENNILVHVESFNKKSIESTKLSISTKIPEYLSLEKPILAIGPSEVASIEYLKDSALCINNKDSIYEEITKLFADEKSMVSLSKKATQKYYKYHNNSSFFKNILPFI